MGTSIFMVETHNLSFTLLNHSVFLNCDND